MKTDQQMEPTLLDALETALGLISNAFEGDWEKAPPNWRAAAERWRDDFIRICRNEPNTDRLGILPLFFEGGSSLICASIGAAPTGMPENIALQHTDDNGKKTITFFKPVETKTQYGGIRRFRVVRAEQTGQIPRMVAQGVVFSDGAVSLHWCSEVRSTTAYDSLENFEKIHLHDGTNLEWEDRICFSCGATFFRDQPTTNNWCSACGADGGKDPYYGTRPDPSLGRWSKAITLNTVLEQKETSMSKPREITQHHTNEANKRIKILADERDSNNGCTSHRYDMLIDDTGEIVELPFQHGPIAEVGVNGVTNEALLAILIDRMEGFQTSPFACLENGEALIALQDALAWLERRTKAREARGVEGTHTV